jgi:MSHA pilin protein MshA
MKRQQGFTLVELIVVIVILGILAATALPKFINVTRDARISAVNGIAGALRSAVGVAQARYFATGDNAAVGITTADGTAVVVTAATGVPGNLQTGIGAMIGCGTPVSATDCQGMSTVYAAGGSTFRPSGGGATCQATYNAGVVTTDIAGC